MLYVNDQERAQDFWTETMDFELAQNVPYGDGRWIGVLPSDRSVRLVLSRCPEGKPNRDDVPPTLPHSNVMFQCDDI